MKSLNLTEINNEHVGFKQLIWWRFLFFKRGSPFLRLRINICHLVTVTIFTCRNKLFPLLNYSLQSSSPSEQFLIFSSYKGDGLGFEWSSLTTTLITMLLLTSGSTTISVFTEVIGHPHSASHMNLGESIHHILINCKILTPLEALFACSG